MKPWYLIVAVLLLFLLLIVNANNIMSTIVLSMMMYSDTSIQMAQKCDGRAALFRAGAGEPSAGRAQPLLGSHASWDAIGMATLCTCGANANAHSFVLPENCKRFTLDVAANIYQPRDGLWIPLRKESRNWMTTR